MIKIFGARAKVFLKYDGEIKELAKEISSGLMLPEFDVEFREYPPHDLTGMCEALGFGMWLDNIPIVKVYNFVLEMQTELSHEELMLGRMHDLSPWLARFIATICDIETAIFDNNDALVVFKAKSADSNG